MPFFGASLSRVLWILQPTPGSRGKLGAGLVHLGRFLSGCVSSVFLLLSAGDKGTRPCVLGDVRVLKHVLYVTFFVTALWLRAASRSNSNW